ncbi:cytochrome P450 [Epibacterium ulvae]|nr:cytochrome P450 [Epibacterium ulvae]
MMQSAWASARTSKRLDTELAMQLRIILGGEFRRAKNWNALRRALRGKGFSLKVEQGQLRLIDSISRVDICSTGFLGFPLSQLEQDFGAPVDSVKWHNWLIG